MSSKITNLTLYKLTNLLHTILQQLDAAGLEIERARIALTGISSKLTRVEALYEKRNPRPQRRFLLPRATVRKLIIDTYAVGH
jgi:hypothetical protein